MGVKWLDGEKPPSQTRLGKLAGSEKPANAGEWEQAVQRLNKALDALIDRGTKTDLLEKRGGRAGWRCSQTIASHSSYHIGSWCRCDRCLARGLRLPAALRGDRKNHVRRVFDPAAPRRSCEKIAAGMIPVPRLQRSNVLPFLIPALRPGLRTAASSRLVWK